MKGHEFRRNRNAQSGFSWESTLLQTELSGDSLQRLRACLPSDLRSQPTTELSLGSNYKLPLLGLLMSCTTDVAWPGRQMGFSFLQELARWTQGWVRMGRVSHGQREHGGTFSSKLCSTLGLDHQLANLHVHIGQDGF